MAEPDESSLLAYLSTHSTIDDSYTYAQTHTPPLSHQALIGLLNSLAGDGLVELSSLSTPLLDLTQEGESILANGSPEWRVFQALGADGE
jgi:hypothetical protein